MAAPSAGPCLVAPTDSLTSYVLLAQTLAAGHTPISTWPIQSPRLEAPREWKPWYLLNVSPAANAVPAHG